MFVSGWKWYSGIKDGPLPFPVVLWVSVKEKPDRKKGTFGSFALFYNIFYLKNYHFTVTSTEIWFWKSHQPHLPKHSERTLILSIQHFLISADFSKHFTVDSKLVLQRTTKAIKFVPGFNFYWKNIYQKTNFMRIIIILLFLFVILCWS